MRCRGCRTTHVLLPAAYLPRRADTVQIIGAALLATLTGASHRTIAADLDLPPDTISGWIRRATAHASNLRQHATILAHRFDPELPPMRPAGTPLGDALEAPPRPLAGSVSAPRPGNSPPGSPAGDCWPRSPGPAESTTASEHRSAHAPATR